MMARITSTMVGKILNKMYLYKKKAFFKNACLPQEQIFLFCPIVPKIKKKKFCYNFEDGRKDTSMDGKQVKIF